MFDVGKTYSITTIELSDGKWTDTVSVWTVAAVDGSLIKLTGRYSKDRIVNTASWHFVSAELVELSGTNLFAELHHAKTLVVDAPSASDDE